jgi:hypothetical protein
VDTEFTIGGEYAALVAWLTTLLGRYLNSSRTPLFLLILGLVLGAAFLLFIGPMIVILGSIAVTGRTM